MKSIVIGIAGGTGSGKSTFTKKLKDAFKDDVAVLYHDNYYRDQREMTMEERKKLITIIRMRWKPRYWWSI